MCFQCITDPIFWKDMVYQFLKLGNDISEELNGYDTASINFNISELHSLTYEICELYAIYVQSINASQGWILKDCWILQWKSYWRNTNVRLMFIKSSSMCKRVLDNGSFSTLYANKRITTWSSNCKYKNFLIYLSPLIYWSINSLYYSNASHTLMTFIRSLGSRHVHSICRYKSFWSSVVKYRTSGKALFLLSKKTVFFSACHLNILSKANVVFKQLKWPYVCKRFAQVLINMSWMDILMRLAAFN